MSPKYLLTGESGMKTQSTLQRTLQALVITGISIFVLAPAFAGDPVKVTGDNYVRGERPGTAATEQPEMHGPADTSSPRATLKSFLDAMNEVYGLIESRKFLDRRNPQYRAIAMRALDTLDTSDLPAFARVDRAGEAALYLKEILDRLEVPPWEDIPDQTAIEAAGGPEQLPLWRIPGMRITIARVTEGPRRHEYLFSPGTVERLPSYFENTRYLTYRTTGTAVSPGFLRWYFAAPGNPFIARLVAQLPDWAKERKFGLTVWKWPGLLLLSMVAIALMATAYRLQRRLADRSRTTSLVKYCLTLVFPIAAMLTPLALQHLAYEILTVRGSPLEIVRFVTTIVALGASFVVVFAASRRLTEIIIASPNIRSQGLDAQFIRLISVVLSTIVSVVLFMIGGQYLGLPIVAVLASAGVGGLAVALAAQDTLKNLFGTLMIYADKPFRVGERIVVGGHDGVVEAIGLRSTRIRTRFAGNLISIPNDEMARRDIENLGRRPALFRSANIRIPLDTPRERVESAVTLIRATLENHQGIDPERAPRVFFDEFNADSFNIRMSYWYHLNEYWDFVAFNEKVNFEIIRAFEDHGIQFSPPLQVTYWATDSEQRPFEVKVVE
jgi:MscS family membrane protein